MSGCNIEVITRCPNAPVVAGLCDGHMAETVRARGRPVGEVAQLRAKLAAAEADNARLRAALVNSAKGPIVPLPVFPEAMQHLEKDVREWRGIAVAAQALLVDYETMMRRGERPGLRYLVDAGLHTFLDRRPHTCDLAILDQGWRLVREEAARLVCMAILEVAGA